MNGTITGGLAYPPVLYNQTLQLPNINIYGTTSDGYPFFATELGVGTPADQITRLVSSLPTNSTILIFVLVVRSYELHWGR